VGFARTTAKGAYVLGEEEEEIQAEEDIADSGKMEAVVVVR
jgi:hypothetical protein